MLTTLDSNRRGALLGITAYVIWGFGALYWIQAAPTDPQDVLAHRALWSVPFVALCLALVDTGRLRRALALLRQPRIFFLIACAALCISNNWFVFLWALTHERVTEASLGYFMVPLVNVAIGMAFFGESVGTAQKLAIALALAAVLLQIVYFHGLPLVALWMSLSFGLYGAIRKATPVESMEGLLLETLLMAPFAIAWLVYRDGGGLGLYGLRVDLFLLGAGAFTAVPLMAYVAASRLLPLSGLGLVFYIGPTLQLLVAVWYFEEPFVAVQLVAFGLVWAGLAMVSLDSLRRGRALRRQAVRPS